VRGKFDNQAVFHAYESLYLELLGNGR
jgi:hypothetical protein